MHTKCWTYIVMMLHCPMFFYGVHQQQMGKALANALGFHICLEEDVTGTTKPF